MTARAILPTMFALTAPAPLPVGGFQGRFPASRPDRSTRVLSPVGRVEADPVAPEGGPALFAPSVPTFAPSGIVIDGRIRTPGRGDNNVTTCIPVNILPAALPVAAMVPDPSRPGFTPLRPNRAVAVAPGARSKHRGDGVGNSHQTVLRDVMAP